MGGIVFPLVINLLLRRVGYPWTMRTFSFALGVFATPTILLIKPRLSPRKAQGNNNEDRVRDSTADEERGESQHVSAPADLHARDADKVSKCW